MLSNLQIENVAIIKNAALDFKEGFNVMTGETGAGKSIIIDSLNAVLGERTSRELIRTGSEYAFVSAVFYDGSSAVLGLLDELGIEPEPDNSIVISRKMTDDGKNVCKINGKSATVSMLKRLGERLVNIHGQLDSQALLNPDFHCAYIDSVAENSAVLEDFKRSYAEYSETLSRLNALNVNEEEKARRLDILSFQINEIEKANIKPGEWEELKKKQAIYSNAEKISSLLNAAYTSLEGTDETDGAVSLGFSSVKNMRNASAVNDGFTEVADRLENAVYELSECCGEIRETLSDMDFDEADINAVEERLDVLYSLSKKYGSTEEEILEFYDNAVRERDSTENADELKRELEIKAKELYDIAYEKAQALSETRKKAGKAFCENVCGELRFLNMPSVKFYVNISEIPLCENGTDNVEFFLSANLGEEPKPLHKIASGGELSRIMLAIKSVLADKDDIGTLVFDEIDTGVSGAAAQKIGMKLREVSKNRQVICVTHLAIIAAFAHEHILISKTEKDGKTYTELQSLSEEGRVREIARIIGGAAVTESNLNSAREMLLSSREKTVDKR